MAENKAKMVASYLAGKSPDEIRVILLKLEKESQEAIEEKRESSEKRQAELSAMSIESLTAELARIGDNPRQYWKRARELNKELDRKLQQKALKESRSEMDFNEWQQVNTRRAEISAEIEKLTKSPDRNIQAVRKLQRELASMPSDPERLVNMPSELKQ